MKKHFLLTIFISLCAATVFATTIGPQSVKVTFNDGMTTGWEVSNSGSMNASAGLLNVTMGVQKAEENKYRADIDHKTLGTFTFDKTKDVIWAIKLSAAFVGNLSFEFQYVNSESGNTYISQSNIKSTLSCADGGTIYYTDFSSKYGAVQDGTVTINVIRFKMAEAVFADAADAHYSVDWIASFASLNDLKSFTNWNDEDQEATPSLPYYEACFRPKADGSGYDSSTPYNGFAEHVQFEGNYNAKFFALEYFLLEDFSDGNVYTLSIETNGGGGTNAMAVWDLDEQIDEHISASDIKTKATSIIGIAPGATEGETNDPIASSSCVSSFWTFTIPAYKLTPLATYGNKTLVGLFVTSQTLTSNSSCKYATSCHATKSKPSMTKTGFNAVINTTNVDKKQWTPQASLSSAVSAASTDDVITLFGDITVSSGRLDIAKSLTIQSATGAEKIICGVAANTIMILAKEGTSENPNTLTFKNLVIDGNNIERGTQTLEAAGYANLCLDGVRFVNTSYSAICGDVKNTGNKNIVLKNTNVIPNGIYLNMNKRVKHEGATHTSPIKIVLANDYVPETYSIVLTCSDPTLYTAELANGTAWQLFKKDAQNELAGRTMPAHTYDLTVTAAGMATLVLGFDAELPSGVKAYTLTNNGDADIWAEEVNQITKNRPVLVVADADTYTFTSAAGVALDEQADPSYGCLKGTYEEEINVPESAAGVYNYILKNGDAGVGFYKVPDGSCKIRSNRAYLSCGYNSVVASAPMRIRFKEDTATGVEQTVAQQSARKLIINGELFILRDEHLYRIDGRMVK